MKLMRTVAVWTMAATAGLGGCGGGTSNQASEAQTRSFAHADSETVQPGVVDFFTRKAAFAAGGGEGDEVGRVAYPVLLDASDTSAPAFQKTAAVKAYSTQADQFFYAESFDRQSVYRFAVKGRGGHFYTASVAERDLVIANLSAHYEYEGLAFYAYSKGGGYTQPVYRFFNMRSGYHLYTADEEERAHIASSLPDYAFDGIAYFVGKDTHETLKPLHRFLNARLGYHFYTANDQERARIQASQPDFQYEGVAFSVFGSASVPFQGVGGSATSVASVGSQPFLQFSPALSTTERTGLSQGRELFVAQWVPAPDVRSNIDGLGPLLNANACTACHVENGRAPSLLADGSIGRGMLFRIGNVAGAVSAHYGGQLQDRATVGLPEGTVTWSDPMNSGDIAFALSVTGNPLEAGFRLGPRLSPQLIGMGLLDLVSNAQILEFSDADDVDSNGISGRPHWLTEGVLGRFGWKAIHETLRDQIAGALHQDMGLTTSLHASENCTDVQPVCANVTSGGAPEVDDGSLDHMTRFMTALAVPPRRQDDLGRFQQGGKLFTEVGCAQCHRPVLRTGSSAAFPSLSNQLIYPYTDLLLHDMGAGLSDGVKEHHAEANEWRTPPLWGIGLVASSTNARFLHDGRAQSVDAAVRWHGGEAAQVRQRYEALSEPQRANLLYFVHGL